MKKRKTIFLICFSLVFISFFLLYPLPESLGKISSFSLNNEQTKIILSEPIIMFVLGSALLGTGMYARRKFKK
jgi:hypothetical protein